jgi:glucose/arabinose dehydrogenase
MRTLISGPISIGLTASLFVAAATAARTAGVPATPASSRAVPCDANNADLTLPAGFCATVFADKVGAPRHMVVAPNGDLLVIGNPYATNAEAGGARAGGSLMLLRDEHGTGKASMVRKLKPGSGSGIALANGYLYSSDGTTIVRYRYATGDTALGPAETIISGIATGGHTAYNFVIVGNTLYMNVGSRTNACQPVDLDRKGKAPGVDPCTELETRAGVWAFDANKADQHPSDGVRFATGMRNSVSLTVDRRDNTLWATMHGRDQLNDWGFTDDYSAENPAEQVNHIMKGDDFGWPYCYWSTEQKKLVTAPEYGGDGKQSTRCTMRTQPVYEFPAHWAPNDMMFYTGAEFPAKYKQGAFVAFHGSWNRAPKPQQGFRVVFLPLRGGKAAGAYEDFALDFSNAGGPGKDGRLHRPTGLAQGTDGSLYIADDIGGTIYKISYRGK